MSEPERASRFDRFAEISSQAIGSTAAFVGMCALSVVWLLAGWPLVGLASAMLAYTTLLTVTTQLTGQLIQRRQNRFEARAERHYEDMERKIDELIKAIRGASNELIGLERRDEAEFRRLAGDPPCPPEGPHG